MGRGAGAMESDQGPRAGAPHLKIWRRTVAEERKEKIMSVRLPWWLYERLKAEAQANERTAGQQLRYILTRHFERQDKAGAGREASGEASDD